MKIIFVLLISAFTFQSCSKEKPNLKKEEKVSTQEIQNAKNGDSVTISNKEDIQKYYAEFQEDLDKKKLDSVSFNYECDGREGTVTYFSKDSKLKIIRNEYAEYSHYSAVEKYFVNNEKPFFIFKDEAVWHFDGGTPEKPETKDDVTESRIYLIENKVIDCLEKKYSIRSVEKKEPDASKIPNKKFKDCKSQELLSEFEKLLKHKKNKEGSVQCL
ncbi:hypothetical protein [Chryseobacterium sp.]|uniref:hypothetical protein n=1 Tax=Chryseobacterium sp. TaxID=1871047 RepID=UPI002899CCE2|nr:hypothetical protein [Chryseobacterium sp.]